MYFPVYFGSSETSSKSALLFQNGPFWLPFSISMIKSQSEISHVMWKIRGEFYPRIIVTDGQILWVPMIGNSHFSVNKLWLRSPIKLISSQCIYENDFIKSGVIENLSKLEGIESEGFKKTSLRFLAVSASVQLLSANCFSECRSLSLITFESGSRLSRIERWAFFRTGLIAIIVPASVEIFDERCFYECISFSSVTFESESRLSQIDFFH
jgi:hypothetical protein